MPSKVYHFLNSNDVPVIADTSEVMMVSITRDDVETKTNAAGGPNMVIIDVTDGPTRTGRFWVSVSVQNGRPVVRVSTQTQTSDKSRKIPGTWRDFSGGKKA